MKLRHIAAASFGCTGQVLWGHGGGADCSRVPEFWDGLADETWIARLGQPPRCVLLCDGEADRFARRRTEIVGRPEVKIAAQDRWQPQGTACVREAQLDKMLPDGTALLPGDTRQKLRQWWLTDGIGGTQNRHWDIASTCTISGRRGLLLVEAKSHMGELSPTNRCCGTSARNREWIKRAMEKANARLRMVAGDSERLSADDRYQDCNRFAWSWKLTSLRVPVALVYLGFRRCRNVGSREPVQVPRRLERRAAGVLPERD